VLVVNYRFKHHQFQIYLPFWKTKLQATFHGVLNMKPLVSQLIQFNDFLKDKRSVSRGTCFITVLVDSLQRTKGNCLSELMWTLPSHWNCFLASEF
jgi:hypothetical protein